MATNASDVLEREVRIAARAETIFPFLVDAERMTRWIGMDADLDPRQGGVFRLDMNGRNVAVGEFVEVDPYRRVVFTWGWDGENNPVPPGSSTVEITLIPVGNETILRLRHLGLPAEQRDPHGQGWDHYLARLVLVATGVDPGPDSLQESPSQPQESKR
jgi:uncharacterized protein YndB with AHSA1/START domain